MESEKEAASATAWTTTCSPANALGFYAVRVLQGAAMHQQPRSAEYEPDVTVDSVAELAALFL